jgi:methylglutaconyl-CoA hydratase
MKSSLVLIEQVAPAIISLTLNRPDKRNALNIPIMEELCKAIEKVSSDPVQRIIIIKGSGEVFCAGLDLKEASDPKKALASAKMVAQTLLAIHETPLVTIASIHGAALAGGAGLMAACDFVIAAHDAKIGFPEVRRGLVAGLVMTFLRRQLKERDIRELLLTGDVITAERAQDIGLVNRVIVVDDIMHSVNRIAESILKGGPEAIARTKMVLDDSWPHSMKEDLNRSLKHHIEARKSKEAILGMKAFLEKKTPPWVPEDLSS